MTYRKDIDQLRAFAVVAVFLYHINHSFFIYGFLGVDLFFVISGYLISKQIFEDFKKKKFNLSSFYIKRARRLLPLLFTVILSTLLFAFIFFLPMELVNLASSAIYSIFFTSNFYFWKNINYFDNLSSERPLLHLWSLSVEEQFYIFFPIFIVIGFKFFKNYINLSLILITFTSFIIYFIFYNQFSSEVFYFPITRAWQILLGYFAFKYEKDYSKLSNYSVLLFFTLIILMFSPYKIIDEKILRIIISVTTFFILLNSSNKNFSNVEILNLTGRISYGFYLWHFPILSFLFIINYKINFYSSTMLFIFTYFLSLFSYRYIENPFRDARKINTKKFLIFISSSVFFFIILLSLIFVKNGYFKTYKKEDYYFLNLNKKKLSNYVIKNFDKYKNNKFKNNNLKNILIIGDSYAQDFTNIFLETNNESYFNISTKYISVECLNLYINKRLIKDLRPNKCNSLSQLYDEDLLELIKKSDVIYLSSYWNNLTSKFLDLSVKNIENISNAKIYVIGLKNFRKISVRDILNMEKSQKYNLNFEISNQKIRINETLINKLGTKHIDLFNLFCENYENCLTFVNKKLISFDGGHLTKEGVTFFSELLFKDFRVNLK